MPLSIVATVRSMTSSQCAHDIAQPSRARVRYAAITAAATCWSRCRPLRHALPHLHRDTHAPDLHEPDCCWCNSLAPAAAAVSNGVALTVVSMWLVFLFLW